MGLKIDNLSTKVFAMALFLLFELVFVLQISDLSISYFGDACGQIIYFKNFIILNILSYIFSLIKIFLFAILIFCNVFRRVFSVLILLMSVASVVLLVSNYYYMVSCDVFLHQPKFAIVAQLFIFLATGVFAVKAVTRR